MLGRADEEGLVGDDHATRSGIKYHRVHFGQMAATEHGIIGREHVLGLAPWPVALDDAGDGDVADFERVHDGCCLLWLD